MALYVLMTVVLRSPGRPVDRGAPHALPYADMATNSSVRVSADTREAIARLAAARKQTAGELVGELVAEAERSDEQARKRSADFLKFHMNDETIFDLEVLRTVRESAWRTPEP